MESQRPLSARPPYADARSYGRIHPDHYLKWFVPFTEAIVAATAGQGAGPRTARPAMIRLDQVDENRGGSIDQQ